MEVNGLDFDVRVKGVLFEQDSTASAVGNVQVIREALVLEVLVRLLERNHVPCLRNVLFIGTFSASSRSRIPTQDSEANHNLESVATISTITLLIPPLSSHPTPLPS